jgi:hypothetical protein
VNLNEDKETRPMQSLINKLLAARAVSTPLLAVTTPDQPAMTQEIADKLNGETPVVGWDRARGLRPLTEKGREALEYLCAQDEDLSPDNLGVMTADAADAMRAAYNLPAHTILVAQSLNRFLNEHGAGPLIQAVLNLRDAFKGDQRTLIMTSETFDLPGEIKHDVIMLDDPLPEDEGYGEIVASLYESADLKAPDGEFVKQATRSVRGLSGFEAEQVLAMSLAMGDGTGIDLSDAWAMKKGAVAKIKGLSMSFNEPDDPDLADLRGLDSVIASLNKIHNGPVAPELYVRVDEIDKGFAGLGSQGGPGDNTGVSQDLHEQFLTNMEDNGWTGYILAGVRGGGKTVLTQSIGKAHGVPTIAMDTGAMKGRHVGDSEQAFRDAFRTIKGIGGRRVCILATCNNLDVLPPELLRRFKLGIWFFDLLSKEEREALWPVYLKKYGHALDSKLPDDEGWTGAEIRNCCEIAYMTGDTVESVGKTMIVPIMKSNPASIESMRVKASESGFLSAAYEGAYVRSKIEAVSGGPKKGERKLSIKKG